MRALVPLRALLIALLLTAVPAIAHAQVVLSFNVGVAPPLLPEYQQPYAPAPNYIWTPGYWAWGSAGYYWVPGTWAMPPQTGLYWTPGYWGANSYGNAYGWSPGYWGPQVGYYGGVNYGYGYGGNGYYGGEWRNGAFAYNTAVTRVNPTIVHNTYVNRTVINKTVINRTSYNGGRGGIQTRPTAQQEQFARQRHVQATTAQVQHQQAASRDRDLLDSVNRGKPPVTAVNRPMTAPPKGAKAPTDADRSAASKSAPKPAPKPAAKPPAVKAKPPS